MRSFFFHPTVFSMKKRKMVAQRATVAAIQDVERDNDGGPIPNGNTIFCFGTSVCSPRDQFVKKYGRQAAMGKAQSKHPTLTVRTKETFSDEKAFTAFFLKNAMNILSEKGFTVKPKETKKEKENEELHTVAQ